MGVPRVWVAGFLACLSTLLYISVTGFWTAPQFTAALFGVYHLTSPPYAPVCNLLLWSEYSLHRSRLSVLRPVLLFLVLSYANTGVSH